MISFEAVFVVSISTYLGGTAVFLNEGSILLKVSDFFTTTRILVAPYCSSVYRKQTKSASAYFTVLIRQLP